MIGFKSRSPLCLNTWRNIIHQILKSLLKCHSKKSIKKYENKSKTKASEKCHLIQNTRFNNKHLVDITEKKLRIKSSKTAQVRDNMLLDKRFEKMKKKKFQQILLFNRLTFSVPQTGQDGAM